MTEKTQTKSGAATGGAVAIPEAEEKLKSCSFPGCRNPHHARGYCKKCYSLLRRVGPAQFEKLVAQAKAKSSGPSAPKTKLTKTERLELLKKRYEIRQQEIEAIRQSLETED
jgi:hypothetical protein